MFDVGCVSVYVCVIVLCVHALFAIYCVMLYGVSVVLVCDCVCLQVCVRSKCLCFECGFVCGVVCSL